MNQVRTGAALLGLALAPFAAHAQAWLPEKGSMSLSLDYTELLHKKHYLFTGAEIDIGHTSTEILNVSATYSPSDRVMIQASLPYVKSRYRGEFHHPTVVDDGRWHSTVTDLLLTAHFQWIDGPIGFAPYVGAVIPTQDYVVLGHAAPGRGLEEYWVGFYTATSLNDWVPRTYLQFRGNYAFVEKVADVTHDRTNATLEIGHFLSESWSARVIASKQWTHGGVNIPVPAGDPLFPFHDQLAEDEFVNVGAGATWAANERMSFYALYMQSIDGRNSHKVDHRVSVGVSYGAGRAY
ncbi:MAG: hypothetical protein ACRETI_01315 [Steroidobacteraceae bacterium]